MRRLLAYLFVILVLGLFHNFKAFSEVYCVDKKIDERIQNFKKTL